MDNAQHPFRTGMWSDGYVGSACVIELGAGTFLLLERDDAGESDIWLERAAEVLEALREIGANELIR